jgi:hypothetical protein
MERIIEFPCVVIYYPISLTYLKVNGLIARSSFTSTPPSEASPPTHPLNYSTYFKFIIDLLLLSRVFLFSTTSTPYSLTSLSNSFLNFLSSFPVFTSFKGIETTGFLEIRFERTFGLEGVWLWQTLI